MRKDVILGKLPDPFLFADGTRAANLDDWQRRRQEILDEVITTEFGGMPPKPDKIEVEPLDLHGTHFTNTYRIHCGTKDHPFSFCFMTWRPAVDHKCPVILTGDMLYDANLNDQVIAEALRRGFVVAKFNRVELAPDLRNVGRTSGIFPLWPELKFSTISAWAWGYQRVVDALLTLDYVDPDQIAVTGHSRGGKTTLLAGATDDRIAYVNPNGSGTHGCGCYRFEQREEPGLFEDAVSEPLSFLFDAVPYWMGPEMHAYIGCENTLPHDMHFIKALVAPRILLETNGYGDIWSNPRGSWLTHLAAKEVWKLYGVPENCLAWYRSGGHAHGWADFNAFFDLMDAHIAQTPLPETFFRVPYTDMEPLHDWSCQSQK